MKICITAHDTLHILGTKTKTVQLCRWWDVLVQWLTSQFSSSLTNPPAGFLHIVWLNTGSNQEQHTLSAKLHQRAHTESKRPHKRLCHLERCSAHTKGNTCKFFIHAIQAGNEKSQTKHVRGVRQHGKYNVCILNSTSSICENFFRSSGVRRCMQKT